MRRLYLVRHGEPELNVRTCIGLTDTPLSGLGRLQGCVLGESFADKDVSRVFCSYLSRSADTAGFIGSAELLQGSEEHFAGDWENLSFDEIRRRWPELYRLRGEDPTITLPNAESIAHCMERFEGAVKRAMEGTDGDVVLVSHATVMQTLLCTLCDIPLREYKKIKLPYGSVTTLLYDGSFTVGDVGLVPRVKLTAELCERLLDTVGSERITAHCRAVRAEALRIASELNDKGLCLDTGLIERSALLHDIARREKSHGEKGAQWLNVLGFTEEAELVAQHESMNFEAVNEAAVVHIADKCISGTERVTLEERFSRSLEKCNSPEAKEAHGKKYSTALEIRAAVNATCGKETIL